MEKQFLDDIPFENLDAKVNGDGSFSIRFTIEDYDYVLFGKNDQPMKVDHNNPSDHEKIKAISLNEPTPIIIKDCPYCGAGFLDFEGCMPFIRHLDELYAYFKTRPEIRLRLLYS